jgi:coenzyme Q-binding protein COQ10
MPKFSVTRRVPFTVEQVFSVARDVGSYKQFLPLVKRSIVRDATTLPDGREVFNAELVVAYKKLGISETMMSKVTVDAANNVVVAQSSEGPVQHLNAEWRIVDAGGGASDIQFSVDYALKSRSLQFILSGMFDMIVRRIMTAFEERTRVLYGNKVASL